MTMTVLTAAAVLGITGLILGALIAFTAKKFDVEADPRTGQVAELLPGANCGGCGFAGCAALAEAIVLQGVSPYKCSACSADTASEIAGILGSGADMQQVERKTAIVFCSGANHISGQKALYNGILDCRSASNVAGGAGKACRFGCLGYGTCARTCPFGAIEMVNGLAVVHAELCKGCGKCEDVCPRKLIRLVPASVKVHVYCNSLDKPAVRRKNCSSACISCNKCVKAAPDSMHSREQLVRVNCANPPGSDFPEKVQCPTGALQTEAGHPVRIRKGEQA